MKATETNRSNKVGRKSHSRSVATRNKGKRQGVSKSTVGTLIKTVNGKPH